MQIARSTLAGAAAGVVLLAGVAGFGIALPELTGNDLPTLPDRIDDRFVALSAVTAADGKAESPEEIAQMKAFASDAAQSEKETTERLGDLYDDAVVRSYLDVPATVAVDSQTRPAQFAVTVVPGDAGLVIPSGPFQIDQSGTHYELSEVDGKRCSAIWSEPADPATGAPTGAAPTGADYQVECRTERSGLTYDLYSSGLTPDEAVHYLDLILEKTA